MNVAFSTVFEYQMAHGGILPRLGDDPPPWAYKGFLLPYVQEMHAQAGRGGVGPGDRWGYYFRTLEAGRLLDEPIPQVRFGNPDRSVTKSLERWTQMIGWDMGGWSDFGKLLDWLTWALGCPGSKPPELDAEQNERLYRGVDLKPLIAAPYDYLGDWISERKLSRWNPTGFYPTPDEVVELMIRMNMVDLEDGRDARAATVCDPCCGTGRMLLHASNMSLRLYGTDIDWTVVRVTLINGVLYAPWLTFPFPESVFAHAQENNRGTEEPTKEAPASAGPDHPALDAVPGCTHQPGDDPSAHCGGRGRRSPLQKQPLHGLFDEGSESLGGDHSPVDQVERPPASP